MSDTFFPARRRTNPAEARWKSEDPAGFGTDSRENQYRIVENNPVNLVDPSGLEKTTEKLLAEFRARLAEIDRRLSHPRLRPGDRPKLLKERNDIIERINELDPPPPPEAPQGVSPAGIPIDDKILDELFKSSPKQEGDPRCAEIPIEDYFRFVEKLGYTFTEPVYKYFFKGCVGLTILSQHCNPNAIPSGGREDPERQRDTKCYLKESDRDDQECDNGRAIYNLVGLWVGGKAPTPKGPDSQVPNTSIGTDAGFFNYCVKITNKYWIFMNHGQYDPTTHMPPLPENRTRGNDDPKHPQKIFLCTESCGAEPRKPGVLYCITCKKCK